MNLNLNNKNLDVTDNIFYGSVISLMFDYNPVQPIQNLSYDSDKELKKIKEINKIVDLNNNLKNNTNKEFKDTKLKTNKKYLNQITSFLNEDRKKTQKYIKYESMNNDNNDNYSDKNYNKIVTNCKKIFINSVDKKINVRVFINNIRYL